MKETVPRALDGERVDRVVAFITGLARAEVAALVSGAHVRLDGATVEARSRRVAEGNVVEVDVPAPTVQRPTADARRVQLSRLTAAHGERYCAVAFPPTIRSRSRSRCR